MGRDRDDARMQPVEPEEAQARGNGPNAVRRREGKQGADVAALGDSVRWGPIWAGLLAALTTFLLLQLLAIGIGLQDVGPGAEGGGGWVPAIIGLIAFFTGGLVAGMTSAVRGTTTGLLNGFLVWALGTVLILLLSALGLGQIFGALGNVADQLGLLQGGVNVPDFDPTQVAQGVRDASLGAFFGLLLSALAAMLGGWFGSAANRRRT